MSAYHHVKTSQLDIAYLEWNPAGARRRAAAWLARQPRMLEQRGRQAGRLGLPCALPGAARLRPDPLPARRHARSGELAALGRDLLDFRSALGLERPVLVGHDWGARAAGNACSLDADAASHLVLLSVGYGTNSGPTRAAVPGTQLLVPLVHGHAQGAATVRDSRREFTRYMWDTWSPAGWYEEADFDEAARAFDNPDWAEVVLHSYRQRWGHAQGDPAYAEDAARLTPAPVLAVPTLVLHGGADACNSPATSEGKDAYFSGRYQRRVLDGIGHFRNARRRRRWPRPS